MTSAAFSLADLIANAGGSAPEMNRYVLEGQLGAGAASVVFLCRDTKTKRELALKLLRPNTSNLTDVKRFHREARALSELNHPNVVRIFDHSQQDDALRYLLMEHVEGESLQAALAERGTLPALVAAAIGHELASALEAVHRAGLIHRDVKPDNVMVEPSGRVVLIDFGLVKGVRAAGGKTFLMSDTILIGTPGFASPEQVQRGEVLSAQSDFFSLGASLYYALSGHHAFEGANTDIIAQAVLTQAPEPLENVPPALQGIINKLMQKEASLRFPDAGSLRRAFARLLEAERVTSPRDAIAAWLKEVSNEPTRIAVVDTRATRIIERGTSPWWWSAAAIAAANALFAIYYLR